jgi:hypothetical protein
MVEWKAALLVGAAFMRWRLEDAASSCEPRRSTRPARRLSCRFFNPVECMFGNIEVARSVGCNDERDRAMRMAVVAVAARLGERLFDDHGRLEIGPLVERRFPRGWSRTAIARTPFDQAEFSGEELEKEGGPLDQDIGDKNETQAETGQVKELIGRHEPAHFRRDA